MDRANAELVCQTNQPGRKRRPTNRPHGMAEIDAVSDRDAAQLAYFAMMNSLALIGSATLQGGH